MVSTVGKLVLVVALLGLSSAARGGDDLDTEVTWGALQKGGRSFVFGRLQGRFDGMEYRGRKIRVVHHESGAEHTIPVERALGDFEAVLPVGVYSILSIEAVYFPPAKSIRLDRFKPVPQRYMLQPLPDVGLPAFAVLEDSPVYLGTIRSGGGRDGLVYVGHTLEIVDEYADAIARLERSHGFLFESLASAGVEPRRHFFLEPIREPSPLEYANVHSPLSQARTYIEEQKYQQALGWLQTFMPTTDAERAEVKLLVGETHLGSKNYHDAIEELGEVLVSDPENTRALRLLARAHALEGHREDAINLYRALAHSMPDDAEASLHLGYESAIAANKDQALQWFDAAFRGNFDYLLHDLTPYALALKSDGARYEPPKVVDGALKMPSTMRSRRGSRGGFGALLDHSGRLVAVHMAPNSGEWAPTMMMAIVRARFQPARLNGVPIPCLVIIGEDSAVELEQ